MDRSDAGKQESKRLIASGTVFSLQPIALHRITLRKDFRIGKRFNFQPGQETISPRMSSMRPCDGSARILVPFGTAPSPLKSANVIVVTHAKTKAISDVDVHQHCFCGRRRSTWPRITAMVLLGRHVVLPSHSQCPTQKDLSPIFIFLVLNLRM
jgi:hypothetical protein